MPVSEGSPAGGPSCNQQGDCSATGRTDRIDTPVYDVGGAARHKGLMELVGDPIDGAEQHRERESCLGGTARSQRHEDQHTEYRVSEEVAQRAKSPGNLRARKGGQSKDHRHPGDDRDPP